MLVSKLSGPRYPTADPAQHLQNLKGIDPNDDPVFQGRLAAFTRDYGNGQKFVTNSAYRPLSLQEQLFLQRGGRYDPNLGYYWPASIPANKRTVAKPGKSLHNYRLARDTTSLWAKKINSIESTDKQLILRKYGLFKPMTIGNHSEVLEDWHFQPIETLNTTIAEREELQPFEVPTILAKGAKHPAVKELQKILNKYAYKLAVDGDFGAITEGAVRDFQRTHGLPIDGKVTILVWKKLFER